MASSSSDKNLTILVSGAIRDIDSFKTNIQAACKIAVNSEASRIIISTWAEDHDKAKQITSDTAPNHCKFTVVSSRSLPADFRGNWIRQSILLFKGLTVVDSNSFVLKMRTDKTEWASSFARHSLIASELPAPLGNIFKKRIVIPGALAFEPFFYNDMVFAGIASDIQKLVPRSMQPILEQWTINPEQVFHIAPVQDTNDLIAAFFRQNKGLPHGYNPEQLTQRNANILRDLVHLTMAKQSLEHLSRFYAFPEDINENAEGDQQLQEYLGNDIAKLIQVMSTPPPAYLSAHLRFNEGAKSLVVTSSAAVKGLLTRVSMLSDA